MLQIQQAYFGAVDGKSHGQLASSSADRDLRAFLTGVTDRPGVPSHDWAPYLAATTFGEWYLISRTWPDSEVERAGMVFTHVLMLPLASMSEVPVLGPLLDQLLAAPPAPEQRPSTLEPLAWPLPECSTLPEVEIVPASWREVLQQLVDGTAPVVVVGEAEAFQTMLEALWRGLPGTLRAQLHWGLRFAPPKEDEAVPLLVHVQPEAEAKWRGQQTIQLDITERATLEQPLEELILGGHRGSAFRDFLETLEVNLRLFSELKRCQRAFQQYHNLQTGVASAGELLSFMRALHMVQPDPGKAATVKQEAVEHLAVALLDGQPVETEAMALRAMPLTSFSTGTLRLGTAVGTVVQRMVSNVDTNPEQLPVLLKHLAEFNPIKVQAWWRDAAIGAYQQIMAADPTATAKAIWLGLGEAEHVQAFVLEHIPNKAAWEQQLSSTVPESLAAAAAEAMTSFCAGRGWWSLFAATVAAAYAPAEALRRQVKAEKKLRLDDSPRVKRLAALVAGPELVQLAVQEATPQLLSLAGARCGADVRLLASMDVRVKPWRQIWAGSLGYSQDVTAGLPKADKTINTFLSEVAEGRADEQLPLQLIAASEYANVLDLAERAQLWDRLAPKLRVAFTAATLDALVKRLLVGDAPGLVEDLVPYARQAEFNNRFLSVSRRGLAEVLTVNSVLGNLTDDSLQNYLAGIKTTTPVDAAQVGKLILARRWQRSADALLAKAKQDPAFRPGLAECASMFNNWTRLLNYQVFGWQLTPNDAWQHLTDCMSELYQKGPDEEHIWKRAGGDVGALSNGQNRREQWVSAISLLRRGGGGRHITTKALIDRALDDFANNPKLLKLRELLPLLQIP